MIRRALVLAAVSLTGLCGSALAASPDGPRLATAELIETKISGRDESAASFVMSLSTIGPSGERRRRLVHGKPDGSGRVVPFPYFRPAWSADGSQIAFVGPIGSKGRRLYVASADGSGVRAIPGTKQGSDPVFSPDGHTLAFARTRFRSHVDVDQITKPDSDGIRFYSSTTTWVVDLAGGKPRRLTRWRDGLSNVPGSFSPDGSTLFLTRNDNNIEGSGIVSVRLDNGATRELIQPAVQPALSPDGSQVAFVGYLDPDVIEAEEDRDYLAGELYVMRADGTEVRRLTNTDDVLESSPSWDPSGQRIAYVQIRADASSAQVLGQIFPIGNALMQVNADGTCREKILSLPKVAFYGAAWQPGPGREAGRIPC